jgi:hypothetical protein
MYSLFIFQSIITFLIYLSFVQLVCFDPHYFWHESHSRNMQLKTWSSPKNCATSTGLCYELHFSRETCNRSWISYTLSRNMRVQLGFSYELHFLSRYVQLQQIFATSCTVLEKHATGLELVALLWRNMQIATLFWYELHFSSRYVQLQPVFTVSYTFLEKRATGLELVALLSWNMQVVTMLWYELHF